MTDTLLLLLPFLMLLFCTVQTRYLTATEAATELRVSRSKLLSWLRSGKLRGSDVSSSPGIGRARWRISRSDLDDFLAGRAPKATTTARRSRAKRPAGWVTYF